MKTEFSHAWERWRSSPEGRQAHYGSGINVCRHDEKYLQNRLHEAFSAGWNARSELSDGPKK